MIVIDLPDGRRSFAPVGSAWPQHRREAAMRKTDRRRYFLRPVDILEKADMIIAAGGVFVPARPGGLHGYPNADCRATRRSIAALALKLPDR